MLQYIFSFFIGGLLTTTIVYCEINGFPLLSRTAALFPVFTWLSYIFIGLIGNTKAVAQHTFFVLFGTLFAWVPYMLFIYFFVQKWGTIKTLTFAIILFLILAIIFNILYKLPTGF